MGMEMDGISKSIMEGDVDGAVKGVRAALEKKVDPLAILTEAMVPGINRAGELWRQNVYFLPDVILAAEAYKECSALVTPKIKAGTAKILGKVAIGDVEGDMHDLGKEIVIAMLRANGFEVDDLGVDVPVSKFVDFIKTEKPNIVGMGAYMSTTMLLMKDNIDTFVKAGLRDKIKVMVGGVPITQKYSEDIGADAWGKDALDTVVKAKKLLGVA